MRFLVFWLAAAALSAATDPPSLRLGNQVYPEHYALDLTLDPDKENYAGKIVIALRLRSPTSMFWLNGTNLKVEEASIAYNGTAQKAVVNAQADDFIGFSWPRAIPSGGATLTINYRATASVKSSDGIFQVKQAGRNYLFSQFESVSARRAFPCFDEPSFKAPWQVTLHVPRNDLAFSNTSAQTETVNEAGIKTITFRETKPLPSYLVALAAGPFEVVEAGKAGSNRVPIRVIVPQGRSADASYAKKVIPELLRRLEEYFGIPYPYEKLDSIAVPLFQGSAMENAGLITYDDPLLLRAPDRESIRFQRTLASVAAHEMAHQWFGDLVTMAWWNDTWLNEAFATWMSSKILKEWKPEWHSEIDDLRGTSSAANVDGLASARRITQPVESKSDIANAFDSITYMKGGAVIGMFEASTGPENFRRGVHAYLSAHAFGNGRTEDFLAALDSASPSPVGPAFRTFLDQPGIPEVSVSVRCAAGAKPVAIISQKRSQPLGSQLEPETWRIPVCLKFESAGEIAQQCLLVTKNASEAALPAARACPGWVLPNAGASGYYRVNYPGDSLRQLLERGGQNLSLVERASILGDALALTRSGALPAAAALAIVPLMVNSPERELVEQTQRIASGLGGPIVPAELQPNRARFILKTFGPKAQELGWVERAGDSEDTRLLRESLVEFVAVAGEDRDLASAARELAAKWLQDRKALSRGMAGPVLRAAASEGNRALFDQYRAAAMETKVQDEQETLLGAMGAFRNREIARVALEQTLKNDFDLRVSIGILFEMTRHLETQRMPFDYVRAHFDELIAKAPASGDFDFGAFLPFTAQPFCRAEELQEVKAFFGPRMAKFNGGPRNLSQVLESIEGCVARKAKQEASLTAFYKQF